MHDAYPLGWQSDGRGFWTKRKKSAVSLLSVLALIAGIAVAFKLFDREVPNNVVRDASVFGYEIWKWETAVGDNNWVEAGPTQPIYEAGVDQFPADNRRVRVEIRNVNQPARTASFQVHVDQTSIVVNGCLGIDPVTGDCTGGTPVIDPTDPLWNRFVNFWTLNVSREDIFTMPVTDFRYKTGEFSNSCSGTLRELVPGAPCELGVVYGSGTTGGPPFSQSLDRREYRFDLHEEDDGTDQSQFKGWTITFTFVFNARVPALPE